MKYSLRPWSIAALAFCALCIFCGALRAAPTPELRARVDTLLDQLEDPDASVRMAADAQLNSLPGDAADLVEAAARRDDLGVEQTTKLRRALTYLRPRAKTELARKTRLDWEIKTFVAAYNAGGHMNQKDAPASRAALAAYVRFRDPWVGHRPEYRPALVRTFQKAVDAGTTDPLVLTLATIADGRADLDERWRDPDGSEIVSLKQVLNGPYPLIVKYYAELGRLSVMSNWVVEWPRALEMLKELARDPSLPPRELDQLAVEFFDLAIDTLHDDKIVPAFVQIYTAAAPTSAYPLVLQAIGQARLAEQHVVGITNDADWKFFYDNLQQGEDLLNKAWRMDPADSRVAIAALRLRTDQGMHGGGRESMETWFQRAISADPDSLTAYRLKLGFLYAHADDGHKAYLEFARDCLNTQDYHAGIPGVLMEAHLKLADGSGDSAEYFARSDVWLDAQSFYETSLLNFPDNLKIHGEYAQFAAKCGHWDVVRTQCGIIGDKPTNPPFKSMESYNYLKKKAARLFAAPDK
ncbi:MAG TPA: hypothetical protein VFE47_19725 [Tepidisphaeraceae bacterium]|nr:hypothetical protein [Tepidisphaeraceae bacterium]